MSGSNYEEIINKVSDPVETISLNWPAALNALTAKMLAGIRHAVAAAEQEESVKLNSVRWRSLLLSSRKGNYE